MDTNIPTAWMDDERQVVRPRGDPRCGALKVNTDLLPLSNESTDINSVFSGAFFSLSKIPRGGHWSRVAFCLNSEIAMTSVDLRCK